MVSLAAALPALVLTLTVAAAGQETARLELKDLDGARHSLKEFQGKIVILNFWATWCAPCLEEMPLLVEMQRRYQDRGVQVIGASADDESTQARIPSFVERLGITFPVWVGATTEHLEALGMPGVLPVTVIVDRDGRIAGRILGVAAESDLENYLEWLLGDRSSPAPPARIDNFEQTSEQEEHGHEHHEDEEHTHQTVGLEGASTVPS